MNPVILAAVIAPLLFAIMNFLDKFMVTRVATSKSAWVFSGFFAFLVAITAFVIVALLGGSVLLHKIDVLSLLITGFFQIAWLYFYFKALETEDTSTVVPFMQFIGVFTYLLALVFLHEVLAMPKLIGLAGVLIGGVLLSYNPKKGMPFKKEALYMLLAMLIISLGLVFFKKSTLSVESFGTIGMTQFLISVFWMYIGMGMTTLLVYLGIKSFRSDLRLLLKNNTRQIWQVMSVIEILSMGAVLLVSFASLKMAVAKVSAFESIQLIYVLLIGIIGTKFLPKHISEKIDKETLPVKIFAIVLMLIGGALLV